MNNSCKNKFGIIEILATIMIFIVTSFGSLFWWTFTTNLERQENVNNKLYISIDNVKTKCDTLNYRFNIHLLTTNR
jgi:hypothetical protein